MKVILNTKIVRKYEWFFDFVKDITAGLVGGIVAVNALGNPVTGMQAILFTLFFIVLMLIYKAKSLLKKE